MTNDSIASLVTRYAAQKADARHARTEALSTPRGVTLGKASRPLPEPEPETGTHITRPAFGKLPVDRVCYEDAVAMGQRGSLQNYLASWGVK